MNKIFVVACTLSILGSSGAAVYSLGAENSSAILSNSYDDSISDNKVSITDRTILMSKDVVFDRMINTVDYFDTVKGNLLCSSVEIDKCALLSFESDLNTSNAITYNKAVYVEEPTSVTEGQNLKYSDSGLCDSVYYCDGEHIVMFDYVNQLFNNNHAAPIKRDDSLPVPKDLRYFMEDGEPHYTYRANSTNLCGANMAVFPQEYAYGYLMNFDFWSIDGYTEILKRKCVVLKGNTEKEYSDKVNVDTFEMYVDCETGILLKFLGFDKENSLTKFMVVQDISIDEPISDVIIPNTDGFTSIINPSPINP